MMVALIAYWSVKTAVYVKEENVKNVNLVTISMKYNCVLLVNVEMV
jgi:hypothetical protein